MEPSSSNLPSSKSARAGATFFGIIILVVLLIMTVRIIGPGEQAVVVRLGQAQETTLAPGVHFVIPILDKIYTFSTRTQKLEATADAASRDLQSVTTRLALNFSLEPQSINKLYQEIGTEWQSRILEPALQESVKSATSQFSAEELITRRSEMKEAVKTLLTQRLSEKYILVDEVSITDFRFSQEFDSAIEAKQVAEQNALKAKQDLERIKIEAEQRVTQAKAEADSLELQRAVLTPDLLQLRAIEKWDGKLPSATGGATPFIQIPQK